PRHLFALRARRSDSQLLRRRRYLAVPRAGRLVAAGGLGAAGGLENSVHEHAARACARARARARGAFIRKQDSRLDTRRRSAALAESERAFEVVPVRASLQLRERRVAERTD